MSFRFSELAIAVCLCGSVSFGQDQSWKNLGHIEHSNYYTFFLHNKTCLQGRIQSAKPDSLALDVSEAASHAKPSLVTIVHSDVIQAKDGRASNDILYSARSSWRDVRGIPSHAREHLYVVLKSGKPMSGQPAASTDSQLSLKQFASISTVVKTDVALVYYIRIKPASGDLLWFAQEAGPLTILNPQTWPYLFNIGVQMRVLLYNVELPEDNTSLVCSENRQPHQH